MVNNLRDLETDARAGKRTLSVRLGLAGTKFEFLFLVVMGFMTPVVGFIFYGWPGWVFLSLGALVPLLDPLRAVMRHTARRDPATLIPPLGATAQAAGLYGLLLGLGLSLG